ARVPLFLCTGPANLADWPPSRASGLEPARKESYDRSMAEIEALLGAKQWQAAREGAEAALLDFPGDALLHYGAGKALEGLGRLGEARQFLLLANDLDALPHRALTEFNEKIRSVAGRAGLRVVDLVAILGEGSPTGLPGSEMIADNCHPTPEGSFLIATSLMDAFGEESLIEIEPPSAALVSLENYLEGAGRAANWTRYLLNNARSAMRPPNENFQAAGGILKEALERDPENWEVLANVATLLLLQGDGKNGKIYLEKATRLKGSPIDPDDREVVPFLKEAMEGAGR
ncbi:MAG: hypothetical protein ACC661_03460, partial [Verrucomicrobiales bacterium]